MVRFFRLIFIPAVLTSVLVVSLSYAEVTLRIYMEDGTLRSGTLIKETDKDFVILTNTGRAELSKDEIMFINGKTLAQWKDRPDKLFQTEIIPEKLPNSGYVNDKSLGEVPSLPTPLAPVEPVRPLALNPAKTKSADREETKLEPKPSRSNSGRAQNPLNKKAEAKPAPVTVAAKKSEPVKMAEPLLVNQPNKTNSKPAVAAKKNSQPTKAKASGEQKQDMVSVNKRPVHFSRKATSNYHYQKGLNHLNQTEKGKAAQEFHYTAVLDRRNTDAVFKLGKYYKEAGVFSRARILFKHPGLKKNLEARALEEEMVLIEKSKKKKSIILFSSTGGALLLNFPLIFLIRKIVKARTKRQRVFDSENLPAENFSQNSVLIEQKPAVEEKLKIEEKEEAKVVAPIMPEDLELANISSPNRLSTIAMDVPRIPDIPSGKEEEPRGEAAPPRQISKPTLPEPPTPIENIEPAFVEATETHSDPLPLPIPEPALASRKPDPAALPPKREPTDEEFKKIQLKYAKRVDELVQSGNTYAAEEKFSEANRSYRTAMTLDPKNVEANLGLAYINFINNLWDVSLEYYMKVLEIDPTCADAHYGIGRVLMETRRVEEAIPEFQKTLDLDPSYDDARETLSSLGLPG